MNFVFTGDPGPKQGIINGVSDARKAVRQQSKNGADLIKITATGGVLSVAKNGENAKEFSHMVEAGMSHIDAIFSATKTASELIEKQDVLGTIEKGKFADIIAVSGNPLQKVEVLEEVVFVIKNEEIYKNLTK